MSRTQEVTNFFYSQYFSDGLKITFGALAPALLFSHISNIPIAITISLGAIITSIVDTPGPVNDRRSAMSRLVCVIFAVSFVTKTINNSSIGIILMLITLCFVMSMLAVYGARAASFGTASILVMLLNIDDIRMGDETPLEHALFLTGGAAWYTILSLAITQFRPFRQAQQELAESMHHIANYVRIKARFYDFKVDPESNYQRLIDEQVVIHTNQSNLRELLFKSKAKVKDTTRIGRLLVVVFTDMVDIFEKTTATHYDYKTIREKFTDQQVLSYIKNAIEKVGDEIDNLSYYVYANKRPKKIHNLQIDLDLIKKAIDDQDKEEKNTLVLKKILINIRTLTTKIESIYQYFDTEEGLSKAAEHGKMEFDQFIAKQNFGYKLLKDNLTLESGTFRHALRMVIVMLIAYFISKIIPFGHHSYWILMTVLVILKPGFSLTKQRNYQRMIGTIIGGLAAIIVLLAVHDEIARFAFLLIFMILTYSFIRLNYIIGVMFLTPYLFILYSFLGVATLDILKERIIDTVIGSSLAFCSSYVIFPSWEGKQVQQSMRKMLIANYNYLVKTLAYIAGVDVSATSHQLVRKDLYVNMANITSTFQRMITEPKSKQRSAKDLNRFVIFNHILSSYSVALVNVVLGADRSSLSSEHVKLLRKSLTQLAITIKQFNPEPGEEIFNETEIKVPNTLDDNNIDSDERKLITELANFIYKISEDLNKVCYRMELLKQTDDHISS